MHVAASSSFAMHRYFFIITVCILLLIWHAYGMHVSASSYRTRLSSCLRELRNAWIMFYYCYMRLCTHAYACFYMRTYKNTDTKCVCAHVYMCPSTHVSMYSCIFAYNYYYFVRHGTLFSSCVLELRKEEDTCMP